MTPFIGGSMSQMIPEDTISAQGAGLYSLLLRKSQKGLLLESLHFIVEVKNLNYL